MSVWRRINHIFVYSFLILVALLQLSPLLATLFNSFRSTKDITKFPIGFPSQYNLENYIEAWKVGEYTRAFANSIIVSSVSTISVVLMAIIAGFFLARSNFKIKDYIITYFGVALSIPVFAFLVPVYFSFSELGLVDHLFGLILLFIAINMPFNILLSRTYILGIPRELDESATMDGCSVYQIIWNIIFPISKPIITTIALIVFVTTWNEFTVANTFLQSPELKTASTKYVLFVGERGSDLSLVYTAGIVTMLPIVAVFISLQNYFIEGMTTGSIK